MESVDSSAFYEGDEYDELMQIAKKFTPSGNKLSFQPGRYSLVSESPSALRCRPIINKASEPEKAVDGDHVSHLFDFQIVVGQGEKQQKLQVEEHGQCYLVHHQNLYPIVFLSDWCLCFLPRQHF